MSIYVLLKQEIPAMRGAFFSEVAWCMPWKAWLSIVSLLQTIGWNCKRQTLLISAKAPKMCPQQQVVWNSNVPGTLLTFVSRSVHLHFLPAVRPHQGCHNFQPPWSISSGCKFLLQPTAQPHVWDCNTRSVSYSLKPSCSQGKYV